MLMRIAINTCKDMRRGAWFRHVDRTIALEKLHEPIYQQNDQDDSLVFEIMRLPEKLKIFVLLYYYQDMPVDEICKVISISSSSVYNRLKEAKKILRERFKGRYFNEE